MRDRRALLPGASYFLTVNLADRSARLLVDRNADLREVVLDVRRAHPFAIVAYAEGVWSCLLPFQAAGVGTPARFLLLAYCYDSGLTLASDEDTR